eukprot:1827555-Pyramimonas_sp.AAC.1
MAMGRPGSAPRGYNKSGVALVPPLILPSCSLIDGFLETSASSSFYSSCAVVHCTDTLKSLNPRP